MQGYKKICGSPEAPCQNPSPHFLPQPAFPAPTYQGGKGNPLKSVENKAKVGSSAYKVGPSFEAITLGHPTGVTPLLVVALQSLNADCQRVFRARSADTRGSCEGRRVPYVPCLAMCPVHAGDSDGFESIFDVRLPQSQVVFQADGLKPRILRKSVAMRSRLSRLDMRGIPSQVVLDNDGHVVLVLIAVLVHTVVLALPPLCIPPG